MDEDERAVARPRSETDSRADLEKSSAAIEVNYPTQSRRRVFMPYVSRLMGPVPDFYDAFAAGIKLEYIRSKAEGLRAMRKEGLGKVRLENGHAPPKEAVFNWGNVMTHALIDTLENHTVSLGSGKGRREAVEMGKSNQMPEKRSRWSLRRER